ncbi:MAG: hypothetical protein MZV63_53745 [Marinilabiliales bacterium]|nr:hypothetical protein [Marinilabiliales bacterium]
MEGSTILLAGTAVTIGFIHTLIGPDHYLPFIVMGEARKWSIYERQCSLPSSAEWDMCSALIVVGFIGIAAGTFTFKT